DPADPVHRRRQLLAGTSCTLAGDVESLSGARGRLDAAGSRGRYERDAMTLKRRITVLLIAGLVIAAVVGVYYVPQWQQTARRDQRTAPPRPIPAPGSLPPPAPPTFPP